MNLIIESLQRDKHERLRFRCGEESLDAFLHASAHQAAAKNLSKTFVAVDTTDESVILGYYTVTPTRIDPGELAPGFVRAYALPSNRSIPASLIARLAVTENVKGQGIGSAMVFDAMRRCANVSRQIGGVAIVVDALSTDLVSFYTKLGFTQFEPGSRRLFIMMDTVEKVLVRNGMIEPLSQDSVGDIAG